MLSTTRLIKPQFISSRASEHLCKSIYLIAHGPMTVAVRPPLGRASYASLSNPTSASTRREFHSTEQQAVKESFPETSTEQIRLTKPAWSHPIYTEAEMNAIQIAHREAKTWSDKTALAAVRLLRWGMDLVSGYRHDPAFSKGPGQKDVGKSVVPFTMNEEKYINRFIFLESVAGVPGMVGGMLRHLHSMRRMKRDNGWMETLLEESYNERMHLLTFLRIAQPNWFMRFMVLGAQGVFFNGFFLAYLISPKTCHRFVGYLEEEAVVTYSRAIADLDTGKLPKWQNMSAPDIAINYWNMSDDHRTMRDLLNYIRADEAKHREVNHTLGNLDQEHDPNPFVSEYKDPDAPHPGKGITHIKSTGWERKDVV